MANGNYSSWAVGWTAFAAVMLILVGVFDIFVGIVALVNDEFYVVGREWVFEFDVTAWGVIQIIIGTVLLLSGIGLFSGNMAARVVGVIVAGRFEITAVPSVIPGVNVTLSLCPRFGGQHQAA